MELLPNDILLKIIQKTNELNDIECKKLNDIIKNLIQLIKTNGDEIYKCNKCNKYGLLYDEDKILKQDDKCIVHKCNKCLNFYHMDCIYLNINDDANICKICTF